MDFKSSCNTPPGPVFVHSGWPCVVRLGVAQRCPLCPAISGARSSAIVAFHLGLLCLLSVVLYRTGRLHAGPTIGFAVTCLVMATTTIHRLARPQFVTWLFLAVLSFLLERAKVAGDYGLLPALPVLMILWVNLHPGFVAGLLVLGA